MRLKAAQSRTKKWADDRGLLDTDDASKQSLYVAAEAGELVQAMLKGEKDEIIDGIGDTLVTLANYAQICTQQQRWGVDPWCAEAWGAAAPHKLPVMQCAGMLMCQVGHINNTPNAGGLRNRDACIEAFRCLRTIAEYHNHTLASCWEWALDEIEGRTGRTVDGVFVKDDVSGGDIDLSKVCSGGIGHVVIGNQRFAYCDETSRYVEVKDGRA